MDTTAFLIRMQDAERKLKLLAEEHDELRARCPITTDQARLIVEAFAREWLDEHHFPGLREAYDVLRQWSEQ